MEIGWPPRHPGFGRRLPVVREMTEVLRILIPLDGSAAAEKAIPHAAAIARIFSAEIDLLGIIDTTATPRPATVNSHDWQRSRIATEVYLARTAECIEAGGVTTQWQLREGDAARAIIQFIGDSNSDLLIMTRYGGGNAQRFPMGGTVQKVVSTAAASILLVDPSVDFDDEQGYGNVLVAMDGSQCSEWALRFAALMAQAAGGFVNVLRVVREPSLPDGMPASAETRRFFDRIKRAASSQATLKLTTLVSTLPPDIETTMSVVTSTNVSATVEEAARRTGADLLIMASEDEEDCNAQGYGQVSDALLNRARMPVLILRPETALLSADHFRSVYLDGVDTRADTG